MKKVLVWVMALVLFCAMAIGVMCNVEVIADGKTNEDMSVEVNETYTYEEYERMVVIYNYNYRDLMNYDGVSVCEYWYMDYGVEIFTGFKCVGYDSDDNIIYEFFVSNDELVDFSKTPLYRMLDSEIPVY